MVSVPTAGITALADRFCGRRHRRSDRLPRWTGRRWRSPVAIRSWRAPCRRRRRRLVPRWLAAHHPGAQRRPDPVGEVRRDRRQSYYIPQRESPEPSGWSSPREGLYPITGVKEPAAEHLGGWASRSSATSHPAARRNAGDGVRYSQSAILESLLQGGYTVEVDGQDVKFRGCRRDFPTASTSSSSGDEPQRGSCPGSAVGTCPCSACPASASPSRPDAGRPLPPTGQGTSRRTTSGSTTASRTSALSRSLPVGPQRRDRDRLRPRPVHPDDQPGAVRLQRRSVC